MPNWAEGNIRIRGNIVAVRSFLNNEISIIGNTDTGGEREYKPILHEGRFGELYLLAPKEANRLHDIRFFVNDTIRNFIYPPDDGFLVYDVGVDAGREELYAVILGFKAAWSADPEPYITKSKKYGVDIAIVTYECGMGFRQRIDVIKGNLTKNETVDYKNWIWDADFPTLGG